MSKFELWNWDQKIKKISYKFMIIKKDFLLNSIYNFGKIFWYEKLKVDSKSGCVTCINEIIDKWFKFY